jgi:hypothetical protein
LSRAVRMLVAGALSALGLGVLAGPASAGIWTEVPSNTTEDITAIEYQSADRFWFTTGAGKIYRRVGGTFQQEASDPATSFKDIEFQAGGPVGFAVGTNGAVWRSPDNGDTWVKVLGITGGDSATVFDCAPNDPIGDVDGIRFSAANRAWLSATGSQIYRTVAAATSTNVGSAAAGWEYPNNAGAGTCRVPRDIDDFFPISGSNAIYFIGRSFGTVWFSADALASSATEKPGSAGNGFTTVRRVAGDPGNPNRQWAVTPGGGGGSYISRTTDGWSTDTGWTIGNPSVRDLTATSDVDFAGGTVLAAGSAGLIMHSIDGATFFYDGADGELATRDWRAVGLASATEGAVGGTGGKLALTSQANVTPDVVAPTGTISGPTSLTAGQAATFTAVLNDTGGSGINAAATAWTVTGLGNASGATATYTFPSPGFYTVRVTFADNAGNTGEASLFVNVSAATTTGPTASPTLVLSGPGNSATAVIIGDRVRIRMRGTIKPPAGVSVVAACNGKVRLTIKKKRKTLLKTRAALKLRNGKCRFGKTVFLSRRQAGRGTRLRLKVRFPGNSVLKAGQTTKTLIVKG